MTAIRNVTAVRTGDERCGRTEGWEAQKAPWECLWAFDERGAMGEGTPQVSVFLGGEFTTVFLADSAYLCRFTLVFSFLKVLLQ